MRISLKSSEKQAVGASGRNRQTLSDAAISPKIGEQPAKAPRTATLYVSQSDGLRFRSGFCSECLSNRDLDALQITAMLGLGYNLRVEVGA